MSYTARGEGKGRGQEFSSSLPAHHLQGSPFCLTITASGNPVLLSLLILLLFIMHLLLLSYFIIYFSFIIYLFSLKPAFTPLFSLIFHLTRRFIFLFQDFIASAPSSRLPPAPVIIIAWNPRHFSFIRARACRPFQSCAIFTILFIYLSHNFWLFSGQLISGQLLITVLQ